MGSFVNGFVSNAAHRRLTIECIGEEERFCCKVYAGPRSLGVSFTHVIGTRVNVTANYSNALRGTCAVTQRNRARACARSLARVLWKWFAHRHGTLSKLRKLSIDRGSAFDDVGGDLSSFHLVILRTERAVDARKSRDQCLYSGIIYEISLRRER